MGGSVPTLGLTKPMPMKGSLLSTTLNGPTLGAVRRQGCRGTQCRETTWRGADRQGIARKRRISKCVKTEATAVPSAFNHTIASIAQTPEWVDLKAHVADVEQTHLKDLMMDENRCDELTAEHNGVFLDFSRERLIDGTLDKLFALAQRASLREKIASMFDGQHINVTEDRPALHVATRARREQRIYVDGKNVVPEVWDVLDRIKDFTDRVRNGEWLGVTGKKLTNVVTVGIGGSFLGPLFVHYALRTNQECSEAARGRHLRFLANVDPIDVARALNELDQEETLVVVVSKTFTTTETMLNARTVRRWLVSHLGEHAVEKHMVAVSTNTKLVKEFGIREENMFGFWDWVGGRYSVCSAVGMLPLSLQYGFENMKTFLEGANDMDDHFATAPFEKNLPVLMGLIGVWNVSFLGCPAKAILPYCQALSKLAPHIQQVSMESNGKGVQIDGRRVETETGEIEFGEPGTNGQHSFYQLIHQGRVVPCEFIGIIKSQQSVYLRNEIVSNHDELMCNFFAQADALANGKSPVELRAENVPDGLIPHRTFSGNRPSLSILLPNLGPFTCGQLLALYEHRIATQGFIWSINSFDQWGVELGKTLASRVRSKINDCRTRGRSLTAKDGFNPSTTRLINRYLDGKSQLLYPEPRDTFPPELINSDAARPPTSYT